MITIDEHNATIVAKVLLSRKEALRTHVLCSKCKEELFFEDFGGSSLDKQMLPYRMVRCDKCRKRYKLYEEFKK